MRCDMRPYGRPGQVLYCGLLRALSCKCLKGNENNFIFFEYNFCTVCAMQAAGGAFAKPQTHSRSPFCLEPALPQKQQK
jgi:hypothetical protein